MAMFQVQKSNDVNQKVMMKQMPPKANENQFFIDLTHQCGTIRRLYSNGGRQ
tara:strand:+ start:83 stop:238 length:156 start_codon:yes stop_codon:yes gene_type:complete